MNFLIGWLFMAGMAFHWPIEVDPLIREFSLGDGTKVCEYQSHRMKHVQNNRVCRSQL